MSVYFITGKLGSGKSLVAVDRIRDYLSRGCKVATNLDIYLDKMFSTRFKSNNLMRLPDHPTADDLEIIGNANPTYDECNNGALVLDEAALWLNTRGWNDKRRKPFLDWMIHARKKGWDVYFLIQNINVVDKQARELLAEHLVTCKRTDRMSIPFISFFFGLFGIKVFMPKFHLGIVRYGDTNSAQICEVWRMRGVDLYQSYDTKQAFNPASTGVYSVLSPWLLKGRYDNSRKLIDKIKSWLDFIIDQRALLSIVFLAVFLIFNYTDVFGKSKIDYQALSVSTSQYHVLDDSINVVDIADAVDAVDAVDDLPIYNIWVIAHFGSDNYILEDTKGEFFYTRKLKRSGTYIKSINYCSVQVGDDVVECL